MRSCLQSKINDNSPPLYASNGISAIGSFCKDGICPCPTRGIAIIMGSSAVFPRNQLLFLVCFICFICPKHMMFVSKTIRCPSGECRDHRHGFSSNQRILKLDSASNFRKTPICEISIQKEPVFFQENRLLCFVCFICFLCLVCLLCRTYKKNFGATSLSTFTANQSAIPAR